MFRQSDCWQLLSYSGTSLQSVKFGDGSSHVDWSPEELEYRCQQPLLLSVTEGVGALTLDFCR